MHILAASSGLAGISKKAYIKLGENDNVWEQELNCKGIYGGELAKRYDKNVWNYQTIKIIITNKTISCVSKWDLLDKNEMAIFF